MCIGYAHNHYNVFRISRFDFPVVERENLSSSYRYAYNYKLLMYAHVCVCVVNSMEGMVYIIGCIRYKYRMFNTLRNGVITGVV